MRNALLALACLVISSAALAADPDVEVIETSAGELRMTLVGHGSLVFEIGGTVIHVDPWSRVGDYARLPDADLVLITHAHGDHLDPAALTEVRTEKTLVVVGPVCEGKVDGAEILRNGESGTFAGIPVAAVPAYNLVHMRSDGSPYHPMGEGNGYVLTFGDARVYVAGDTENTPEMKALEDITVAFLPMNLPYTMSPDMVADAARAFRPSILYPYHLGESDPVPLEALLGDEKGIELRMRKMGW